MISRRRFLAGGALGVVVVHVLDGWTVAAEQFEIVKSDAEWRAMLTPGQYVVLRREGTERPFSSPLDKEKRRGTFACAGCELELFSSTTKFESGTGWPWRRKNW